MIVTWLASAALISCGPPPPKLCRTLVPEPPYAQDTVQVTFLGVGGVVVRWQGQAIMTAPLYSNPSVVEMALSEVHVDRQRVDELMRGDLHNLRNVRAILAGHSHYDHLMDAPYIALHRATNAEIVGNDAMVKLLDPIAADLAPRKLVSVEGLRDGYHDVPGSRFRIRSVISQHSPQIGPRVEGKVAGLLTWLLPLPDVSLWRGEDEYKAARLPTHVGEWTGGTTLAFVIELLERASDNVAFRIYYQDSSTTAPYGYPAAATADHRYDLAILCMGGAAEYKGFPRDIVSHLKPTYVMGVHWEDFFNPRPLPSPGKVDEKESIGYAPGVEEPAFLKAVKTAQGSGGRAIVPCPDKTTVFSATSGSWTITSGEGDWSQP